MKAVAIAFMLIASSYGLMAKEKLNDQTVPLALSEIDSTFFGKTLLDVIQIQLQATPAIQLVIDLLDEIAADLANAQSTADESWAVRGAECNSTRTTYENEIQNAVNTQTAAQSNIDLNLLPLIDSLTNEIADLEGKISKAGEDLTNAEAERAAANALYLSRSLDTADAIAACEEALLLMAQLVNEPATPTLLQTATSTFATLQNTFKSVHAASAYAPLVMSLVSLASEQNLSDQTMVQKIIDLIQELLDDLRKTLNDLDNSERQEVEDHEQVVSTLQASSDSMSARVENAKGSLADANAVVESERAAVDNAQATIDSTTILLNDHNTTCEDEARIYKEETEQRAADLSIIDQVRLLFTEMEETTSEHVKTRTQEEYDLLSE